MTDAAKQYADLVKQSQEAVLAAVDSWTKTVQDAMAELPKGPAPVDANAVVDQVFDFTEKLLEVQRGLAKQLITTGTSAAETTTQATQDFQNEAQQG